MDESLVLLTREVMDLVRAQEIHKAIELVCEARRKQADESYEGVRRSIHALNLAVLELKTQKDRVLQAIEDLGEGYAFDAHQSLGSELRGYFDVELARLKREKKRLSIPRTRLRS